MSEAGSEPLQTQPHHTGSCLCAPDWLGECQVQKGKGKNPVTQSYWIIFSNENKNPRELETDYWESSPSISSKPSALVVAGSPSRPPQLLSVRSDDFPSSGSFPGINPSAAKALVFYFGTLYSNGGTERVYLGSPAMAGFQIELGYIVIIEVSLAFLSLCLWESQFVDIVKVKWQDVHRG